MMAVTVYSLFLKTYDITQLKGYELLMQGDNIKFFLVGNVIAFIVAGFDILLSALGAVISSRSRDNSFATAKDLLDARNSHQRGTAEWDKLNLQYRRYLRKSI